MRCRNNVKVGYSLLSCVVMQHLDTWWSTLKGNTVTGVSKLFTICLDLMFAGEYMQFSLICSLSKSLVLIHVMLTTMYNPMYNTLMLPIVYIRRYICAEQTWPSLTHRAALCTDAPYFIILLCLMPDYFTLSNAIWFYSSRGECWHLVG